MHSDVSANEFLSGISKKQLYQFGLNYSLFSIGFYKGEGLLERRSQPTCLADATLPYSLFEMVKKGFGMNEPSYL